MTRQKGPHGWRARVSPSDVEPVSHQADAARPSAPPSADPQHSFTRLPDNTPQFTAGFYNVGIQAAEAEAKRWPTKEVRFKNDIIKAFMEHDLDILCLSELGTIETGLAAALEKTIEA